MEENTKLDIEDKAEAPLDLDQRTKILIFITFCLCLVSAAIAGLALTFFTQVITIAPGVVAILFLLVALVFTYKNLNSYESNPQLQHKNGVLGAIAVASVAILVTYMFAISWPRLLNNEDASFVILNTISSEGTDIIVRHPSADSFTVEINNETGTVFTTASTLIDASSDFTGKSFVRGLEPSTLYTYQVVLNTSSILSRPKSLKGSFSTVPVAGDLSSTFTFASSSCSQKSRLLGAVPMTGFSKAKTLQPDFMFHLGDLVYVDTPWGWGGDGYGFGNKQELYESFLRDVYRDEHAQALMSSTPMYFAFDDHEILNNWIEGKSHPYDVAIGSWEQYNTMIENSIYSEYYYNFTVGPASFFVMDVRSYKVEQQIIGAVQMARLKQWLIAENSTVTWKFLLSSLPFSLNKEGVDAWGCCTAERNEILDFLTANNIKNVIIVSGDQHKAEIYKISEDLYEASISAINAFGRHYKAGEGPDGLERSALKYETHIGFFEVSNSTVTITAFSGGLSFLGSLIGSIFLPVGVVGIALVLVIDPRRAKVLQAATALFVVLAIMGSWLLLTGGQLVGEGRDRFEKSFDFVINAA